MRIVNDEAMAFLLTRRSRSPKILGEPSPTRDDLTPILEAGLRVPDHGALEPWRVIVLERPAMARLAHSLAVRGQEAGLPDEQIAKMRLTFADSPLALVVVLAPVEGKIPLWEQALSAGAACLGIVNAALASGWGAGWVTGWAASDRGFMEEDLGLAPSESVAGFIHIGTERSAPPERPRPDLARKVAWVDA